MKVFCHTCKKEVKKYIFMEYKRGYLIDPKFRGQTKYFCSVECFLDFIGETKEEPKGISIPKKTADWRIQGCIKCFRRTEDFILINYRASWQTDLMRYKPERNHLCSVDCLREYLKHGLEEYPRTYKSKATLQDEAITYFNKMIEWAKTQKETDPPNRAKMNREIQMTWSLSDFSFCNKYYPRCEKCVVYVKDEGCCNGYWNELRRSKNWKEWIENSELIIEFVNELNQDADN